MFHIRVSVSLSTPHSLPLSDSFIGIVPPLAAPWLNEHNPIISDSQLNI